MLTTFYIFESFDLDTVQNTEPDLNVNDHRPNYHMDDEIIHNYVSDRDNVDSNFSFRDYDRSKDYLRTMSGSINGLYGPGGSSLPLDSLIHRPYPEYRQYTGNELVDSIPKNNPELVLGPLAKYVQADSMGASVAAGNIERRMYENPFSYVEDKK